MVITNWLIELERVDVVGNQVQCILYGNNEHQEYIIICNKYHATYHVYFLSPALETILSISWCYSCCSAVGKNSSKVISLYDGKDKIVKEGMKNVMPNYVF